MVYRKVIANHEMPQALSVFSIQTTVLVTFENKSTHTHRERERKREKIFYIRLKSLKVKI